jgi:hypothetical protein
MNDKLIKGIEPFVCFNGAQLNSVKDLGLALEDMNEDVFNHHVNNEKNDFSDWIMNCAEDEDLANIIKPIKDQKEMMIKVMKQIILTL